MAREPRVSRKKSDRIDPNQVPRPVEQHSTELIRYYTKSGLPPASTAEYMVVDEGNCSPRFVRMTTYEMAKDAELIDSTKLCIGAVIQPLAALQPGEEPIHLVDPGSEGILRCGRCRGYVNPGFKFIDGGSKFKCNLCGTISDVPVWYQCNVDSNGERRDKGQRPELCKGSYEFLAGPEFLLRPIQDPHYLFLVDVSYSAAVTGLVTIAMNSIRSALDALEYNPRNRVGIMTFDHQLHFYSLKSEKGEPSMLVVPDVDGPFVPCPSQELFVSVAQGRDILEALIDLIGTLYDTPQQAAAQNVFSASGCALAAAQQALTGHGGKMLMILGNLCNVGVGKLTSRDNGTLYGGPKEHTLFQPQCDFYDGLAKQCAEEAISVDMYICANSYVDIATIGALSNVTGGQICVYPGFNASKDALALTRDMWRNVTRETGYDGVMVVRCAAGLKVCDYYGNFYRRSPGEMDLPSIDSDKTFGIRMEHEGVLDVKTDSCIQVALLYTSADGYRKIRIHNLTVPVTTGMTNVFRYSDLDAIMNLSLRQAVAQIIKGVAYKDAMAALSMACVECLYVYRKNCASSSPAGQLILPEPLKLLPLSTLGLIKHPLLQSNVSADQRAFLFHYVNSMPAYVSVAFTCPRLFELTQMPEGCCVMNAMDRVFLPVNLKLSNESLEASGVYVLDNGQCLYLWIGDTIDQTTAMEMFQSDQPNQYAILDNGDPNSVAGRSLCLIETLRTGKPSFKNLLTISRNHQGGLQTLDEMQFRSHLIEDPVDSTRYQKLEDVSKMSYIDFLCFIHKQIQQKFY